MRSLCLALPALVWSASAQAQVSDVDLGGVAPFSVRLRAQTPYPSECLARFDGSLAGEADVAFPGNEDATLVPPIQCTAVASTEVCVRCVRLEDSSVSEETCRPVDATAASARISPLCSNGVPPPPPPPAPTTGRLALYELGGEPPYQELQGQATLRGGEAQFGACFIPGDGDEPPISFELNGAPIHVDTFEPHCAYSDADLGILPLAEGLSPGGVSLRAFPVSGRATRIIFQVVEAGPSDTPRPIPAPPVLLDLRLVP